MKYPALPWTDSQSRVKSTLSNLTRIITAVSQEARRPEIFAHVQPHARATARLARCLAASMFADGSCKPTLKEIEFAAHMHDLGKYFIASSILLKPGAFDEEERALVSLHPVYGATIVSKFPGTTDAIRNAVLHHHERWDGNGYPDGLTGTAIPLAARIVSVVDVYTSLRLKRSYKESFSKSRSLAELAVMAGHELDPFVVEDFLRLMEREQLYINRGRRDR